ncbi:glucan biosynthesis protein [Pinisolibacter aquiterrae]|uniref:glucan biosynthesis protein n=1 Tax=Pinisolibacter aquiterrae TaxID=2815579 RepID=UPI001C3E0F16|nr:glucan biosynthesis protein G [Pinisolibacter aquiterrae]MBV5263846.1 glucan biosynthesis protein G [Pinisolibacter aquiterrae]MCC8237239.1 glucan biosynthesis protein G [Pinisolibacter aquiterrae]
MATTRRDVMTWALGTIPIALGAGWLDAAHAAGPEPAMPKTDGPGVRFEPHVLRARAAAMAARPFEPPDTKLPKGLDNLNYDQYRAIAFRPKDTFLREGPGPFRIEWMPRGFLYRDHVDFDAVEDTQALRIVQYDGCFVFPPDVPPPKDGETLGWSGFRVKTPINRPDVAEEFLVFQGASYFRAVGRGNVYGTSARGLAIATADPAGEEFPLFREFWIEKPKSDGNLLVIHALLDSPSVTGAFRISIVPGETTTTSVEAALYPRTDLDKVGLGTLTSMFLFAPNDRKGFDDFRPAVRDAEGLAFLTAAGEHCWRPLANPRMLQMSVFADGNLRGFGLMQRQRSFFEYQDMEAAYEKRPSAWVEPLGDWGAGKLVLVEIPTNEEIHDNIVAFWRPDEPLRKGGEYLFSYRIHWGMDGPVRTDLARVTSTLEGGGDEERLFIVDFVGAAVETSKPEDLKAEISCRPGTVIEPVIEANPHTKGLRLAFRVKVDAAQMVEVRARLMRGADPVTETWLYRWTRG